MKRSGPIARKAPLERKPQLSSSGKPLARKTPLARGSAPLARAPQALTARTERAQPSAHDAEDARTTARTPARTTVRTRRAAPARTGASAAERKQVFDRDGGRCARCGIDLTTGSVGYNDHHRQGRGMGGRQGDARAAANRAARRLTLCGSGTTGCHGWVTEHPEPAERAGMVVRRGGGIDPATVPVLTWRGWVLLDDDGGLVACEEPEGGDARTLAALTP